MNEASQKRNLKGLIGFWYFGQSLDRSATRAALARIQQQLQQKDEEMAWIDSCCLQLVVRSRSGKEERFTFQTESPDIRKDWVIGEILECVWNFVGIIL